MADGYCWKGHESRGPDVMMTKRAMGALGYYPKRLLLDPTDIVDRELHSGIAKFQLDNELYSDGWMAPDGETAGAVRGALARRDGRASDVYLSLMSETGARSKPALTSDPAPEANLQVPDGARISAGTDGREGDPDQSDRQQLPKEEQGSERPHNRDKLRPTHDPVDAQEMYRMLGFDPNGRGQFIAALADPATGLEVGVLANRAKRASERIGREAPSDSSIRPEEVDAFQHALWSYRVTQKLGPQVAKELGDAHERTIENRPGERLKDLFNNYVARELALDPANKGRKPTEVLREAFRNGQFQIERFNVRQSKVE